MSIAEKQGNPHSVFFRCCYGYFVSGMVILSFGAIMPSLIRDSGMNFAAAGGLLSFMAVGNLMASFVFPAMSARAGLKKTISFWAFTVPAVLLLFSFVPPLWGMYILIFLIGISRGSITITNNQAVNQIIPNPARHLNLLHCSFAVGAFTSPFLTALLIQIGMGWKMILYVLTAMSVTSAVSYLTMDYRLLKPPVPAKKSVGQDIASSGDGRSFFRCPDFYVIAFLLFFYLGLENCINGWFVTYLQSTGIMSETFATNLVSVTWAVIMVGRLVTARLSASVRRNILILIQTLGSASCFLVLVSASTLPVITAALMGLGFFLAGIYPTCIAEGGQYIVGSTFGMSMLTAIASLGGILAPQLVGYLADSIGMTAAMGTLMINMVLMIIFGVFNFIRSRRFIHS